MICLSDTKRLNALVARAEEIIQNVIQRENNGKHRRKIKRQREWRKQIEYRCKESQKKSRENVKEITLTWYQLISPQK